MNRMNQNSDNIKFIRMITGEDIISTVSEVDKDPYITMHDPAKVLYMFEEQSRIRMQLIPWVFKTLTDKTSFNVMRRDILLMEDASSSLSSAYSDHNSSDETEEDPTGPVVISKKNLD